MDVHEFEKAYTEARDRLFTFLLRLTGDREEAAEILQEAVFRAFRTRDGFQARASFSTWIYRIAVNVWKNERRRGWRVRPLEDCEQRHNPTGAKDPEREAAGREAGRLLLSALGELEEGYRMAFLLKHQGGFSYREIAGIMSISEEAARIRVYRARQALRTLLAEVGHERF